MKNLIFALEPSFLRFFKMNKIGIIYMLIPFYNCIKRKKQATPKGSKITLLGLDAKGNKNQKIRNKQPEIF